MYTRTQVRIFLRPVACCVLLVLTAGPAAALACELACSSAASPAHDHSGTHGHPAADVHTSMSGALLASSASACDHDALTNPAVVSSSIKVTAPVSDGALASDACQVLHLTRFAVNQQAAASPPGIRSRPLPLRI